MTNTFFEDDLRILYNKTRDIKLSKHRVKEMYRNAKGVQQAIVKVSSYGKSKGRVSAHLDYISRNNDIELEDPTGNILTDRAEVKDVLNHWYSDADKRKNSRMSANIVLSAPKGSDRKSVHEAVRDFATARFSENHDYLFAIHNDTDYPHAHLVVKLRGYDGNKLRLGKAELHEIRQEFAECLQQRGVEVAATYRSDRGIGRKQAKQKLIHMRQRGITPDVDKRAVAEAVSELQSNQKAHKPWELKISNKHKKIKDEYSKTADLLIATNQKNLKIIGESIKSYADKMSEPVTRHQALIEAIASSSESRRSSLQQDGER